MNRSLVMTALLLVWATTAQASGGSIPLGHQCLAADKDDPPSAEKEGELDSLCAGPPKKTSPLQGTSCFPGPASDSVSKRNWYCIDDHAQCAYPGDPLITHRPYAGVSGGDDVGDYICATSDPLLRHAGRSVGVWNPKYIMGTHILKGAQPGQGTTPQANACQKGNRADDTEHCNTEQTVPLPPATY